MDVKCGKRGKKMRVKVKVAIFDVKIVAVKIEVRAFARSICTVTYAGLLLLFHFLLHFPNTTFLPEVAELHSVAGVRCELPCPSLPR